MEDQPTTTTGTYHIQNQPITVKITATSKHVTEQQLKATARATAYGSKPDNFKENLEKQVTIEHAELKNH